MQARFFIDHGTIHDRKTGRHVRTDPGFGPGRMFEEDGIEECCALLNQLALDGFDQEIALRAELAETKRELEHDRGLKEISDGQFREALAEVREELGQEKKRLESAEAALRMYLNTTLPFPADAHFARFGGKHE